MEEQPGAADRPPVVGSVRASALGRAHAVADVRRMVESQFQAGFPHRIWVSGRVSGPVTDEDGGIRFALAAATDDDFRLPCVVPAEKLPGLRQLLDRNQDADLEDLLREGRLSRVGGLLRFDARRGSVVLLVSDADSAPTALVVAQEREQAVQAVAARGLPQRQRSLSCLRAPRHVAVVGDGRDEAVRQVEQALTGSRFGLQVTVLAVEQLSPRAPGLLSEAVRSAAEDHDMVLLVRSAGRPLRLSTYDALELAEAVASAPVPVLTGLGGQGARTACDEVAFAALPAAEDAAGWVLDRLADAQRSLDELRDQVFREVGAASERARQALADARHEIAATTEVAAVRAAAAQRRRKALLYGGVALLVVLTVAAAVVTGEPLVLLALLIPAAVLLGERVWSSRARTTGSRRMGQRDDDFAKVLERLGGIRDELAATSSPEKVAGLRDLADQLLEQGERLLHAYVGDRSVEASPTAGPEVTEALPSGATPAPEQAPAPGSVAAPTAEEPTTVQPVAAGTGPDRSGAAGAEPQADPPGDDATRVLRRSPDRDPTAS